MEEDGPLFQLGSSGSYKFEESKIFRDVHRDVPKLYVKVPDFSNRVLLLASQAYPSSTFNLLKCSAVVTTEPYADSPSSVCQLHEIQGFQRLWFSTNFPILSYLPPNLYLSIQEIKAIW